MIYTYLVRTEKLLLIGPMGAGKSTIGKILAQELNWPYFDNDTELSQLSGLSAEELGEMPVEELHVHETACFKEILSRPAPFISGAAGSVIDKHDNRELIKNVFAIYLRLPLSEIIERAGYAGIGRQFTRVADDAQIRERFTRRDPLYRACATLTVDLSSSAEEDAQAIIKALKEGDISTRG
jgi:shikimate kinase